MKKNIFIALYLSFSFLIHAQENQYIIGSVYDKASGEILISASVYYDKEPKGTITNAEGEFIIEKIVDVDSLVFSYIGYDTKKYHVDNLPQKILLEPYTTNLPEVVIIPGYANKIVEQVWEKYNKIFKEENKSKNKECVFFYRQITQTNTIYNEFIECFLTGENTFNIEHLKLQEGRYAAIKSLDSIPLISFSNFFHYSEVKPFRQKNPSDKNTFNTFIQPNFKSMYDVEIEDRISDNNGDVLILKFQPKKSKNLPAYLGKLYVRESDLSIIRFEGVTINAGLGIEFQVNYKDGPNAYPIIESVTCTSDYNISRKNEFLKYKGKITSTLFLVNQSFDKSGKKLKQDDTLIEAIQKKKYNSEFWRNNPIVKRTTVDEKIIKSFENTNAFGTFNCIIKYDKVCESYD